MFASKDIGHIYRNKNHKLIFYNYPYDKRFEIYDLKTDPFENHNLMDDSTRNREQIETMVRGLAYYLAQSQPGWNILINPNNAKEVAINLEGANIIDGYNYDKKEIRF